MLLLLELLVVLLQLTLLPDKLLHEHVLRAKLILILLVNLFEVLPQDQILFLQILQLIYDLLSALWTLKLVHVELDHFGHRKQLIIEVL